MADQPTWTIYPGFSVPKSVTIEPPDGFVRAYRMPSVSPLVYPDDMIFGRGNCGLLAMAICSGRSLAETTQWFRYYGNLRNTPKTNSQGFAFKGNWKGTTYHATYSQYLNSKWVKHSHIKHLGNVTINRFANYIARPGLLYAIRIRGHILTLKDGFLCDQKQNCLVAEHRCRKKRITDTWEILT